MPNMTSPMSNAEFSLMNKHALVRAPSKRIAAIARHLKPEQTCSVNHGAGKTGLFGVGSLSHAAGVPVAGILNSRDDAQDSISKHDHATLPIQQAPLSSSVSGVCARNANEEPHNVPVETNQVATLSAGAQQYVRMSAVRLREEHYAGPDYIEVNETEGDHRFSFSLAQQGLWARMSDEKTRSSMHVPVDSTNLTISQGSLLVDPCDISDRYMFRMLKLS